MTRMQMALALAGLIASQACRSSETALSLTEVATLRLPGTSTTLVIERRPMHANQAEYHRTVVLRMGPRDLVRQSMFDDTGGYSRTNVYRSSDSTFVLVDVEASYAANARGEELRRDDVRRTDAKSRGQFLGAFDIDSSRTWRFIPATEQPELPVEFRGGTG
jgi:hypothetical protein